MRPMFPNPPRLGEVNRIHPAQDLLNTFNSQLITYRIAPKLIPDQQQFMAQSLQARQTLHSQYTLNLSMLQHRQIVAPAAYQQLTDKFVEVYRTVERYFNTPHSENPLLFPLV